MLNGKLRFIQANTRCILHQQVIHQLFSQTNLLLFWQPGFGHKRKIKLDLIWPSLQQKHRRFVEDRNCVPCITKDRLTPSLPWCYLKMTVQNCKPFIFFFFVLVCARIFIKMHSIERRHVMGPENLLFTGGSVHLSARKLYRLGQWSG